MAPNYFFLMAFVSLMMISMNSQADDRFIPVDKLPAAAKTFIKTHFSGQLISFAEKDGIINPTYEVCLVDGTQIDFDKNGNWDKIDCNVNAVPTALIPSPVISYVHSTYPDCFIVQIDKECFGFDVELSNNLELKFDKQGHLLYIDD